MRIPIKVILLLSLSSIPAPTLLAQQEPTRLAKPGTSAITDKFHLLEPKAVKLGGLMGDRYSKSELKRLLLVNEQELLAGFRKKPGKQAWIGEHVGKWLHAASLVYAATGNATLRAKLDRVASILISTQEADGYLGTYVPEKRWGLFSDADWDVWVHKYDLLGLLTYYQYTGNKIALSTCVKVGDLLVTVFGNGKKSILSAGTHGGMASTSILEAIVLLYRATGNSKYLEFAKYIVSSWDSSGGPKILTTLTNTGSVRKTGNAKAYEMLSNLTGLCELYRATGDQAYIIPVKKAWQDIVDRRLYLTGSGSSHEHWQEEFELPNVGSANICETCVTVTWIQLNIQLLRLLGEARFADQIERSALNHLFGAQKPTADAWCYYTPLDGTKPYGTETNCCLSSGPRGVALLPEIAYSTDGDGLVVNLFSESTATVPVGTGKVSVTQKTAFPVEGHVEFTVTPSGTPDRFPIRIRAPYWTTEINYSLPSGAEVTKVLPGTYFTITHSWKPGDKFSLDIKMDSRVVIGTHGNAGKMAIVRGPLVLAADDEHNPGLRSIKQISLVNAPDFRVARSTEHVVSDEPVFKAVGTLNGAGDKKAVDVLLTPFYSAGQNGGRFNVWLDIDGARPVNGSGSLFTWLNESRSAPGNQNGSITDDDLASFVVTFDNSPHKVDWFSVTSNQPVEFNRVVFVHGKTFHDGGWFDTSKGKPSVEIQRTLNGKWETLAQVSDYPDTTATQSAGIKDGQVFAVKFAKTSAFGLRIIGVGGSGDNPKQNFASCSELQAFLDK